eukprot:489870_1
MLNLVVLSLAIVASKAALSCNGASYTYDGKEIFEAAGVCVGAESISPEYASMYSTQRVCKDGQIYTVTYASSSDCTGDSPTVSKFCSPDYKDCTSVICDQEPCEYIKYTSYSGVISCDPYVVNKTNGGETTSAYMLGVCDIYHSGSYLWECDESGQPIHKTYTTDDCTGTSRALTIDELSGEPSIRCDHAIKYGNAVTYSCATATNDETIQIPGTITAVSGAVSSCGIFVVMIFVIGMLSWM